MSLPNEPGLGITTVQPIRAIYGDSIPIAGLMINCVFGTQ